MKNIIFFLSIFFHCTLLAQSSWTLYPKKDSTIQKDSVVMAKADTLMPDSSISEEAPHKQKKRLYSLHLFKRPYCYPC